MERKRYEVDADSPLGFNVLDYGEELTRVVAVTADVNDALRIRDALNFTEEIKAALAKLDGSDLSAVALLTGFSTEELNDLGGLDR